MAKEQNPAIHISAADFLIESDIAGMTHGQVGAYVLLVARTVVSRVSSDPASVARLLRLSARAFQRVWPALEPLFYVRDGRLWPRNTLGVHVGWKGRGPLSKLLRRLIAFWGDACVYCGTQEAPLEIEHIVPRARGGTEDLSNLTVACQPCNNRKRTLTAAEFGFPHIHEDAKRIQ